MVAKEKVKEQLLPYPAPSLSPLFCMWLTELLKTNLNAVTPATQIVFLPFLPNNYRKQKNLQFVMKKCYVIMWTTQQTPKHDIESLNINPKYVKTQFGKTKLIRKLKRTRHQNNTHADQIFSPLQIAPSGLI